MWLRKLFLFYTALTSFTSYTFKYKNKLLFWDLKIMKKSIKFLEIAEFIALDDELVVWKKNISLVIIVPLSLQNIS